MIQERGERSAYPNLATGFLERGAEAEAGIALQEYDRLAQNVCGVGYVAGSDTSAAAAKMLLLILADHPKIQAKAQAELDAVLGSERLPTIADRPSLPYVHAIVKELGRYYTVNPFGLPHASAEDDEYEGYFIPKGTIIMPNAWAMMHDPEVFEAPFEFRPERYLKDDQIDSSVPDGERAAFGFGRRICPGRYFSNDALFLLTASILARFDIRLPKDEHGVSIPVNMKLDFETRVVVKPGPFKVDIVMRKGHQPFE